MPLKKKKLLICNSHTEATLLAAATAVMLEMHLKDMVCFKKTGVTWCSCEHCL